MKNFKSVFKLTLYIHKQFFISLICQNLTTLKPAMASAITIIMIE